LSLARSTKISSIIVTFKSTATTYWPEGNFMLPKMTEMNHFFLRLFFFFFFILFKELGLEGLD
jgi:hypothetical protein